MTVKKDDVIEFLAIAWDEPQWEFDYPTVVLFPVIRYSPNGEAPEKMIQDLAIDFACGEDVTDQDNSEEFNWRGWKISTLRKVAKERMEGKDTWKTKIRSVVKQQIKFVEQGGELDFEVLKTMEF